MFMAILHISFLSVLFSSHLSLFFFFSWYNVEANGETMEIAIKSLLPATSCSSPTKGSHHYGKLHLVHKNGPCSPQSKERKTTPSLEEILLQDELRVRSIQSRINKSGPLGLGDSKVTIPTKSGLSLGTGDFIVSIGLGTPKQDVLVVMDTGSDLTWVRCQPCINCSVPIFDNSISSSYSSIACGSIECSQLSSDTTYNPTCTSTCVYEAHYGDGTFSIGLYGQETLTLTPSDVFSGFQFGCGQNDSFSDSTSGILGLGANQVSLVSQTAERFGKLFSYCLPSSQSSTGFLAFGDQAGSTSSTVSYTELIIDSSNPGFYYVPFIGISVGGQRLAIESSVFTTPGTIIDSGTVVSRLPPSAYDALRSAFRQAMSSYPSAPPISLYDTCYDLSGYETVQIPSITLHFQGDTDVNVDPYSGTLAYMDNSQICLAFAANSNDEDVVIFGNRQQRTFEVIYDLPGQRLGFVVGACN